MKQLVMLGLLVFLVGCSSSGGESGRESGSVGETYPFSFAMEERNLCGKTSAFSEYEVIAYSDEGEIISRHQPDEQGAVSAEFDQSHVNMMIIRDDGLDKKDLDVTVLIQYPVGDLGTFSVSDINTEGCDCQVVDVEALTSDYFQEKRKYMNLPHRNQDLTAFTDSYVCKLENGQDPLMVISTIDAVFGEYGNYVHTIIENPSEMIVEDSIHTYFEPIAEFDREITIAEGEGTSFYLTYLSDDTYKFPLSVLNKQNFKLIEHPRVETGEFVVGSYQTSSLDESTDLSLGWAVTIPIDEDTQVIDYVKPEVDETVLEGILNRTITAHEFSSENLIVIKHSFNIPRENDYSDWWSIVYLDNLIETADFRLPEDYVDSASDYPDYIESSTNKNAIITEISEVMTKNDFFESGWYEVLYHNFSSTVTYQIREYSSLQIASKRYTQISRHESQKLPFP